MDEDFLVEQQIRKTSLFNYTNNNNNNVNISIYNNNQFPSMVTSPNPPPPLLSPSVTTMNPLLASHLMRQMQSSRPPSPTNSRKNSIQQLRRTSSATTITANINNEVVDKFAFIRLEDVVDEIYSLCKDQYGCRFFQKKLEEKTPEQNDIIFNEIYPHFVELMTGNTKKLK
jgi:hypothetical protein